MVNDFVVFTNKEGVAQFFFWYIWVVITLSYHMDFSFIVLKIGYPGRYCVAQTFYTKKSQVCGKTV